MPVVPDDGGTKHLRSEKLLEGQCPATYQQRERLIGRFIIDEGILGKKLLNIIEPHGYKS